MVYFIKYYWKDKDVRVMTGTSFYFILRPFGRLRVSPEFIEGRQAQDKITLSGVEGLFLRLV